MPSTIVVSNFTKDAPPVIKSSTKILMKVMRFQSTTTLNITTGKSRANETILQFVDLKLATVNQVQDKVGGKALGPDTLIVVAQLYYALDRWLLLASRGDSSVNSRRKSGVEELFGEVVTLLTAELQVTVNALPNWLSENFTVGMTDHGLDVDFSNKSALYYKPKEREVYRLKITDGTVYQQQWWAAKNKTKWVRANSQITQQSGSANTISKDHCGYALSVSGDFYSGPHKSGTLRREDGQFHSSYMGGQPVLCAGEIEIVNGKVKHLNTGSGHYGPAKGYLLNVINALTICGVDESSYTVNFHGDKTGATAASFRKTIETQEMAVGGKTESHLHSDEAIKYYNPVKAGLVAKIKKINSELDAIAHFKDGRHVEGISNSGGSRRPKCQVCLRAGLHNTMTQNRCKVRPTVALEAEKEKIEKIVGRIV